MALIAVGDSLPDVTLAYFEEHSLAAGQKIVFNGVPGVFTPTFSTKHVPGFVEKADELKSKGVSDCSSGSRHQFELTHPSPNSICVACGYQCLTLQDTFACKACNVPVHVECLTAVSRKPVPLCFPSGPSWTPPVALVETPPPPIPSWLSSTHPARYAYNIPVPQMIHLYPPPMSQLPHPYNQEGPPQQALVMPIYPYPYNHPGNIQNTGNGNHQGITQNARNGNHQGNTENAGNGNQQNNTENAGNGNHQGNTENAGNGNQQNNTENAGNGNHQGKTEDAGNGNQQGNTENAGNGKKKGKNRVIIIGKKILKTFSSFLVLASIIGDDLDLPFSSDEHESEDN